MISYIGCLIASGLTLGIVHKLRKRKRSSSKHPQSKNQHLITSIKTQAKVFKGVHYISLRDLPIDQKQAIEETTIPLRKSVKIKTESEFLTGCILYGDYEKWYDERAAY